MNPLLSNFSSISNIPLWLLLVVSVWTLIWKGLALWKAAKKNSMGWFIALLVINTIGILEILYYYLFSEIKLDEKKVKQKQRKSRVRRKAFLE